METKKKLVVIIIGTICVLLGLLFALKGGGNRDGKQDGKKTEGRSAEEARRLDAIMNTFLEEPLTFDKQVFLENADVRITATGLKLSSGIGVTKDGQVELSLLYENYTNQKLFFDTRIISVNQYAVESIGIDCGVAGNDKAEDSTWLEGIDSTSQFKGRTTLLPLGIRNISEIEVEYTVKEDSGLWADVLYQGTKTIQVGQLRSANMNANDFLTGLEDGSYSLLTGQQVEHIASDINFQVGDLHVVLAAVTRQNDNYFLCVQLQNKGNSDAQYSISDIAVNGLTLQNHPDKSPSDYRSVSADKYVVSTIDISPLETVKDCFQLDEIGSVSFLIESSEAKQRIAFDIPGKRSGFSESGQSIYTQNGVQIAFQGFHQRSETTVDWGTDWSWIETTEPVYEMIFFVENTSNDSVNIELDTDSLFFNYKKIQFASYQTIDGDSNYRNFGHVQGGCSGYIIFELDRASIEDNRFSDLSVVTNVEMKATIESQHLYGFTDTEILRC